MKKIVCLFICLFSGLANAVPILDQQSEDLGVIGYSASNWLWQQGVTVGLTGQLTGLEIYSTGTFTTLNIYAGLPWQNSGELASVFTSLSTGWNFIDLTAESLFFDAGDTFTWAANGDGFLGGSSAYAGSYDGGIAVFNVSTYLDGRYDLAFRTYVGVSNVPEPGVFVLLGIGLAGMGVIRRRKKT